MPSAKARFDANFTTSKYASSILKLLEGIHLIYHKGLGLQNCKNPLSFFLGFLFTFWERKAWVRTPPLCADRFIPFRNIPSKCFACLNDEDNPLLFGWYSIVKRVTRFWRWVGYCSALLNHFEKFIKHWLRELRKKMKKNWINDLFLFCFFSKRMHSNNETIRWRCNTVPFERVSKMYFNLCGLTQTTARFEMIWCVNWMLSRTPFEIINFQMVRFLKVWMDPPAPFLPSHSHRRGNERSPEMGIL